MILNLNHVKMSFKLQLKKLEENFGYLVIEDFYKKNW